mmetsp:Transcript_11332/g.16536  ORF Transcript_11332/g.16536 Transcript_11332/m.16536 type:complete len:270 (-) Transcript_11332:868-1677(-)
MGDDLVDTGGLNPGSRYKAVWKLIHLSHFLKFLRWDPCTLVLVNINSVPVKFHVKNIFRSNHLVDITALLNAVSNHSVDRQVSLDFVFDLFSFACHDLWSASMPVEIVLEKRNGLSDLIVQTHNKLGTNQFLCQIKIGSRCHSAFGISDRISHVVPPVQIRRNVLFQSHFGLSSQQEGIIRRNGSVDWMPHDREQPCGKSWVKDETCSIVKFIRGDCVRKLRLDELLSRSCLDFYGIGQINIEIFPVGALHGVYLERIASGTRFISSKN